MLLLKNAGAIIKAILARIMAHFFPPNSLTIRFTKITEKPPIKAGNNLMAKTESPVKILKIFDRKAVSGGTDK
jgi:hypothetical protein